MKAVWFSISVAFVPMAQAAPDSLEASLLSCMALAGEGDRLACFEAVARGIAPAEPAVPIRESAPVGSAPAPTVAAPAPPLPASPPIDATTDFGREHKPSARQVPESMSARVVDVKRAGYGELRVSLDNGQTWQQVGTERYQLRVDDAVVIERATFNSFFLRKDGSTRKVRFTRLD